MEDPSKRSIFITGITGFTGIYLEQYFLDKGYSVYGTTFETSKNPNHFLCDITSKSQLEFALKEVKPDFVIHTAAISFVAGNNQKKMYDVNVFGTLNLLDALLEYDINPEKIILVSSAAVYGNIGEVLSEDMCPQPLNHYGCSKLAMEHMAKNYYEKLNILIVRPFNYTGHGQAENFLIPKIIAHFKSKEQIIELGNIDVYREFNDIGYLVACYGALLNCDVTSETVNICSGNTSSINDILSMLTEISSHKIGLKVNPNFVRKNEIKSLKGSPDKLFNIIGNMTENFLLKSTLHNMLFS